MNTLHDTKGEQKDQLLVTTDKNGHPTGTATREACHAGNGKTHLAFMAFVIDAQGNVVLTKRSDKKSLWAGFWDASVVSHVLPGETPQEAAQRRGKEELGVLVSFHDLGAFYYFAKHNDSAENEYCHVLVGTAQESIHPNPVEISQVKHISWGVLSKGVAGNPEEYAPWLRICMEKFPLSVLADQRPT